MHSYFVILSLPLFRNWRKRTEQNALLEIESNSVCVHCAACPANTFRCVSNGLCIPTCQLCDGYSQCDDYSDESNCVGINSEYSYVNYVYAILSVCISV